MFIPVTSKAQYIQNRVFLQLSFENITIVKIYYASLIQETDSGLKKIIVKNFEAYC